MLEKRPEHRKCGRTGLAAGRRRFPSLPDWVKFILFCICVAVPIASGLLFRNFFLKRAIEKRAVGQ
jgi:hypothetical protein